MRYTFFTLGLIFWSTLLFAQFDPSSYERTSNSYNDPITRSVPSESIIKEQRAIERDILLLVEEYKQPGHEDQLETRRRITFLLHELLDLKINEKEREVRVLDQELRIMQQSDLYKERQAEIYKLQEALLSVKQNLNYRKRHKSEIVLNRLEQLLRS